MYITGMTGCLVVSLNNKQAGYAWVNLKQKS